MHDLASIELSELFLCHFYRCDRRTAIKRECFEVRLVDETQRGERFGKMYLIDGLTRRQLYIVDVCSANIQAGETGQMLDVERTGNARIFQGETLHLYG